MTPKDQIMIEEQEITCIEGLTWKETNIRARAITFIRVDPTDLQIMFVKKSDEDIISIPQTAFGDTPVTIDSGEGGHIEKIWVNFSATADGIIRIVLQRGNWRYIHG